MKVIATDIANLTDARYFAAWGVDALAYNIDPSSSDALSLAQLKEMKADGTFKKLAEKANQK